MRKRVGNLWDADNITDHIKHSTWKGKRKNLAAYAYRDWCRFKGFDYEFKIFREEISPLPYIPSERELDELIASSHPRYSAFLQVLKETAFRPSETLRLTPSDISFDHNTITLNAPSKYSLPRQAKVSDKLLAMLSPLMKGKDLDDPLWTLSYESMVTTFSNTRKRLSKKIGNPNLNKITFKTYRHWKASMTYHDTKDILYVQKILGHRSLKNTLVYTHLISFEENDSFIVQVATTIEELSDLLSKGYEYVTDYNGAKILRKRK